MRDWSKIIGGEVLWAKAKGGGGGVISFRALVGSFDFQLRIGGGPFYFITIK